MRINFAYPNFGIGFHSGWCNVNNTPTQSLYLSYRRGVNLTKNGYEVIHGEKNLPPFLLKGLNGDLTGLSSGAGSTIVFFRNKYFKIKRNGYKDKGFVNNKIPDRGFRILKNKLLEKTDFEVGGAMSLEDAENEIRYEKLIERVGIPLPQKTVGLYKIILPFKKDDAVAMIQEIDSDLRVDELVVSLLINSFYNFYGDKAKLFIEKGEFQYPEYKLTEGLMEIEKIRVVIDEVGKIIGGIYKRFHKNGYLRGIGNSWYGNEVICPNGQIGVCDLESCFSREEVGGDKIFNELCATDLNLARTAFYDSMNYFDNSLASIVGSWLINSFNKGYLEEYSGKLDLLQIKEVMTRFLRIKDKVIVYG